MPEPDNDLLAQDIPIFCELLHRSPTFDIIWILLGKLPKIQITEEWKKYLLHVPVIEAVVPADPTVIPIKVSIRHLVSEYYDWNRVTKRLEPYDNNGQKVGRLKALTKGISERHWFWHKAVRRAMEGSTAPYVDKNLPVLLKEWGLFPEMKDSRPILVAKPGDLRTYWEEQEAHKKKKDDIPLRINGLGSPAISGKAWKFFWNMDIPHAIRTPWWRTLQQKIPTKERLHNIFPGEHTTTCRICQKEKESDKHFWVDCEHKWKFWVRMMNFKKIPPEIRLKDKVWSMIFLQQTKPQDEHILSEIGRVMLAIWITHWNCIK
ncbi:hypothetical protein INT44_004744 [Umbelopsis vinacea]|uniref:Reverse transcriptase zinc-binding domain-containing protein n=1 Tax=Umbelopsis vinacea TaxID=44442 RepID=A0A8H7PDV5_9FUNG|nr:hypothetical protein INT44_004744 [Umbelopsis vinacea]